MSFSVRSLCLLGWLLLASCAPKPALPDRASWRPSAWVELVGHGAVARAAVIGGRCPQAMLDGRPDQMILRRDTTKDFPAVCQIDLPPGLSRLTIDGRVLPVPVKAPQRIVMLGDSGCRIQGLTAQSCNDAKAWPFPTVSALAAAHKPDLVIHVGDYYYRENKCPPLKTACAGSPYGDNWDTWQAEFFQAAAPLLAAAPWVFARGNHEVCERGGAGWFLLLDAADKAQDCPASSAPLAVDIGGLSLYVLDSATAPDRDAGPRSIKAFAAQLDALGPAVNQGQGWIVTHRPAWGLVPVVRAPPFDPLEIGINAAEQGALRGRPLAGVQMVVSGHIHDFGALSFGPARPAQLVVGTGGDVGEPADIPRIRGGPRHVDGMDADFFTFDRFGYLLLDRDGQDWAGAFHDAQDRVVANCRLHERALKCVAAMR